MGLSAAVFRLRKVGLREAAALVDAAAVYLAFRANNPLGDVVLAYARTSFAELDAMLSHLEVDRARLIRGAVFADYLYGAGTRFSLDQEAICWDLLGR